MGIKEVPKFGYCETLIKVYELLRQQGYFKPADKTLTTCVPDPPCQLQLPLMSTTVCHSSQGPDTVTLLKKPSANLMCG